MYSFDREKLNNPLLATQIETLIDGLNQAKEKSLEGTSLQGKGYNNFHVKKVGPKFIYVDAGSSGCFLIDRDGELYNIKAYGVVDYNKKSKCDLGNISKVNVQWLFSKRFNYIRDWDKSDELLRYAVNA